MLHVSSLQAVRFKKMQRILFLAVATIVAAASMIWAGPANAQATRTWVSGVGDDANPCSRTAPCKTFAGAISKTATSGEINCLDPAAFGAVTIVKSITISCPGPEAGVLATGTNGIIVNLPNDTDRVFLENLDIEGAITGLNGVRIIGKGTVFIKDCRIRGFQGGSPPQGNAVHVNGASGARVVISNSTLVYNRGGVQVDGASGAANAALLNNVKFDTNSDFAIKVGAASTAIINNSFVVGSSNSIIAVAGATVQSYGNNKLRGTFTVTQTLPLQ